MLFSDCYRNAKSLYDRSFSRQEVSRERLCNRILERLKCCADQTKEIGEVCEIAEGAISQVKTDYIVVARTLYVNAIILVFIVKRAIEQSHSKRD